MTYLKVARTYRRILRPALGKRRRMYLSEAPSGSDAGPAGLGVILGGTGCSRVGLGPGFREVGNTPIEELSSGAAGRLQIM